MTKDVFIKEVRDAESMLYHISKSILKNDSDCGDAVQETILKAYEKLPTLKKEKYFRTWITRILINECKGILRKRKNVILFDSLLFFPGIGLFSSSSDNCAFKNSLARESLLLIVPSGIARASLISFCENPSK